MNYWVSVNERLYFLINDRKKLRNNFIDNLKKWKINKLEDWNKELLTKRRIEILLNKWNYVELNDKDKSILKNINFLNSQNYITSQNNNFQLFYFSKEKRNSKFINGKIIIWNIKIDFLEKVNVKIRDYFWVNQHNQKFRIYLWNKFLYLNNK